MRKVLLFLAVCLFLTAIGIMGHSFLPKEDVNAGVENLEVVKLWRSKKEVKNPALIDSQNARLAELIKNNPPKVKVILQGHVTDLYKTNEGGYKFNCVHIPEDGYKITSEQEPPAPANVWTHQGFDNLVAYQWSIPLEEYKKLRSWVGSEGAKLSVRPLTEFPGSTLRVEEMGNNHSIVTFSFDIDYKTMEDGLRPYSSYWGYELPLTNPEIIKIDY